MNFFGRGGFPFYEEKNIKNLLPPQKHAAKMDANGILTNIKFQVDNMGLIN